MKLLKSLIWDFHKRNVVEPRTLNERSNICDVLCDTLLLMSLCFIVYSVIVGLPLYFISAIILCCFVGRGEMVYVDLPVDLLISFSIGTVICGVFYLLWLLLRFVFKLIRKMSAVTYKKLNMPTFKVKDKVCFKVDFSDMEE